MDVLWLIMIPMMAMAPSSAHPKFVELCLETNALARTESMVMFIPSPSGPMPIDMVRCVLDTEEKEVPEPPKLET